MAQLGRETTMVQWWSTRGGSLDRKRPTTDMVT
jgi:hypothetical protein